MEFMNYKLYNWVEEGADFILSDNHEWGNLCITDCEFLPVYVPNLRN